jgi:hypothetical protein
VLGQLDVTREELRIGLFQGLRLTAVALAFAAYALLLTTTGLVRSARFRAPLGARDGAGDAARADARARRGRARRGARGRGVEVTGARGRAQLLSPLLAARSSARSTSAEADGGARLRPPGRDEDAAVRGGAARPAALALGALAGAIGALWL